MFEILHTQESRILAITRILLGFSFSCHGAQKLLGALGGAAQWGPGSDAAWIAHRLHRGRLPGGGHRHDPRQRLHRRPARNGRSLSSALSERE